MRRLRHALAVSAFAVALLVPAIPLAAQEAPADNPPPNAAPAADLVATVEGRTVTLDASGSSDSDGSVISYAWDLDGDSVYETDTGAEAKVERSFPTGTALVAAVRVIDDGGAADEATADVEVSDEPEPASAASAASASGAEKRDTRDRPDPTATAAAARSVTITDFEFGPATVTINPGDSVTWTNRGPTNHTATADDGSFDSGNMERGDTYSHTFTEAGSYSYICTPHPFMTGRVVVAGAGGGGSGDGGSGGGGSGGSAGGDGASPGAGTAGGDGAAGSAGEPGTLAKTGIDLLPWSLFGFSLFAFGAALRWRLATD